MKAIVQSSYGSSDVLAPGDIDRPTVGDDDLLVRVHAASVHAGDYFTMKGVPYLARFFAGWPKTGNAGMSYVVKDLIESGQVKPVIDRTCPLAQTAEALEHLGKGHAHGKVVIAI